MDLALTLAVQPAKYLFKTNSELLEMEIKTNTENNGAFILDDI